MVSVFHVNNYSMEVVFTNQFNHLGRVIVGHQEIRESLENLFPFWEGGEEWLKWSGVTG